MGRIKRLTMKNLLTVLFLLYSLTGFSQPGTEKRANWKVGLMFSQDFYRSTSIASDKSAGYYLEPSDFNFTAGLTGQFTIKPKLEFVTGVTYSKKDFTGTYYCHVCDFSVLPQPELIRQRYLEVPALLRYNFLDKKLGLNIEAGLLGGYRTNNIETQYGHDELFGSRYLLSGQAGLGASYDVGQKISLSLTTVYRSLLKNYSKETDAALRSFGLVTGIAYRMN